MLRTVLAGALASGALLASGGAHAQDYGYGVGVGGGVGLGGYDAAVPAYAAGGGYGGYGYAPYRPHGFTLAGARAGVTVLGLDIDGSAKVTIGPHHDGRSGGYAPAPYYPPAPPPEPVYQPFSPPPGYWMGYSAYVPCGCAPPPPPCCVYGGYASY